MDCCDTKESLANCCDPKQKLDLILILSTLIVVIGYFSWLFKITTFFNVKWFTVFSEATYSLMNTMWWGLAFGIIFVTVLSQVPKEMVISALGRKTGIVGLIRATILGLLLDLCNHGILLIGMKLYERGATLGQTMAFLIASPWNSISLTIIMLSLMGWKWTLAFIIFSAVIAILTGLVFDYLVERKHLPENKSRVEISSDFDFKLELKKIFSKLSLNPLLSLKALRNGFEESLMIIRWIMVGVIITALIRAFVPMDFFQNYFGPSVLGLGLTLIAATIIEVCSEGSVPIAADLLSRAHAPGNAFTFLMAGVATDYTEILAIKETTKSWKISLMLPLVTVPQILIISYLLNF